MIKFNTVLRVVYTLAVCVVVATPAAAQSVLNFARTTLDGRQNAGIAVTNPASYYADVQFTLYGLDGNPVASGLVNPVVYRVAPRGQVSMFASDLFAASKVEGWVQATSATSGLIGFSLSGDFSSTLEGSDPSGALTTQVIPVIREDQSSKTEVIVINPGSSSANVTFAFFNTRGDEIGTASRSLASHAAVKLRPSTLLPNVAAAIASVRISASAPVAAAAVFEGRESLTFAAGQPVDQPASARVVPDFLSGNGFDSTLVLTNPNASAVNVTVTVYSETGGPVHPSQTSPSSRGYVIPPNGSASIDARSVTGLPITPAINGWLRIDSPNVPLNGLLILNEGRAVTTVPLQATAMDRMLYSKVSETDSLFTGVVFINPSFAAAAIDLALIRADGTTSSQKTINLQGNAKFSALLRDVVPEASGQTEGYVFMRSSIPIYGVGMLGAWDGAVLASMPPTRTADSFAPSAIPVLPRITRIDPGTDVRPGVTLRVATTNLTGEASFLLGDQTVPARLLAPGTAIFVLDVPQIEPGFVNLRVRSNGVESAAVRLRVLPPDNLPTETMSGQALYQKIPVTDGGLDLTHPVMVPIRNARVEVIDRISQTVVAVSETDLQGRFTVPAPSEANLTIRVVSRLRSSGLRVSDNTNGNAIYGISLDIDGRESHSDLLLVDASRGSGAFNILEMVQRGNDAIRLADPKIDPPAVTIFWSTRNTTRIGQVRDGLIGTTFFSLLTNTAYVLGDRAVDSDEFDDSVIIHEYAHMLATRFSRDDSPGRDHGIGDMLDPRVAWSEGWANFFSGAVRNDAIYRDSMGPNGVNVLRYDLEDNIPPGDKPGYWSEGSVHGLLWDLFDEHVDTGDAVQFQFSLIWSAFTDLKNDRYVYLPYFLDHFLERSPASANGLRTMVQLRSIDFQPGVRPSVTNPFPRLISVGESVTGEVDSLTPRRSNLVNSAHFMSFTTTGGASAIRLDIIGLGPADNPGANDLDLFLLDANGRVIDRSDRGLNGQSELISTRLSAGTYVIEVRSYYTKAETGGLVFNSGRYRLNVLVQ